MIKIHIKPIKLIGGVCGVMVIVLGNGHGDLSLNPRQGSFHFAQPYYIWEGVHLTILSPAIGK